MNIQSFHQSHCRSEVLHGGWRIWINIPINEVLQNQLGVLEVTGGVIVGLPVDLGQSLLEVLLPPDIPLEILVFEEILVLLDQLLGPEPAVLIEQVYFHDRLPIVSNLTKSVRVGCEEHGSDGKWEQVPEGPVPDVVREGIVIVRVEVLSSKRYLPD